jgi:hypothetical protein
VTIEARCPTCRTVRRLPEAALGQTTFCDSCGAVFVMTAEDTTLPDPAVAPPLAPKLTRAAARKQAFTACWVGLILLTVSVLASQCVARFFLAFVVFSVCVLFVGVSGVIEPRLILAMTKPEQRAEEVPAWALGGGPVLLVVGFVLGVVLVLTVLR